MKGILVISFSDLASDPRVNRQIRLLSKSYRVVAAGTAPPQVPGVDYFPVPQIPRPLYLKVLGAMDLKLGRYQNFYWSNRQVQACFSTLAGVRADIIIANDLITLPLTLALARGAKAILDAHEYAPREYEDRARWKFFFQDYIDHLCRSYLRQADGMLTVCESIANEYKANYSVDPKVLINAPAYFALSPSAVASDRIRIVHHGATSSSRRIELMIEMMDFLDRRFYLDLMLMPDTSRYFRRLERLAAKRRRIRIVPPVPMTDLPRRLNEYDIGLFLLPPTNFNYEHALPNKFFEYIQARLAVAIGPSPEMARLVRRYDCGVVAEDFTPSALAARLNALTSDQIGCFKQRSHMAAKDLCFEKNASVLLAMIDRLLGKA